MNRGGLEVIRGVIVRNQKKLCSLLLLLNRFFSGGTYMEVTYDLIVLNSIPLH